MTKKNHDIHRYDDLHATYTSLFKDESDRAAVILAAPVLDDVLQTLLQQVLAPAPSGRDDLFEGATAPLGSLNSKIDMAFRMGLVSARLARDLHVVRRIRNDFAHNMTDCTFVSDSARSRVTDLARSFRHFMPMYRDEEEFGSGAAGDFCLVTSWMIQYLCYMTPHSVSLSASAEEWPYTEEGCEWAKKDLARLRRLRSRARRKKGDKGDRHIILHYGKMITQ